MSPEPWASAGDNQMEGKLLTAAFLGESLELLVYVAGTELRVRCNPDLSVGRSEPVWLRVKPEHVLLLPPT